MFNQEPCFWCGQPVGFHNGEMVIGGVTKKFHRGMLKDCFNEYLKWQKSHETEPRLQLLECVKKGAGKVC